MHTGPGLGFVLAMGQVSLFVFRVSGVCSVLFHCFRSRLQVLHTGPIATHVVAPWLVTRVICGQTVTVLDSTEVMQVTAYGFSIGTMKFDLG